MKRLLYSIMGLCFISSCGGAPDANDAELRAASEAGEKAAHEAMSYPQGSMDREGAIIRIRALETSMRDAGFSSCADSFAASAERVLRPAFQK